MQGYDRRRFIITAATVAGAGFLALRALPSVLFDGLRRRTPAADLVPAVLEPLVGETVRTNTPAGAGPDLGVASVTTPEPYGLDGKGAPIGDTFSVMLEGPAEAALEQGVYEFEHDSLGSFPLFIVPVDLPQSGTQRYQAVFNRLR